MIKRAINMSKSIKIPIYIITIFFSFNASFAADTVSKHTDPAYYFKKWTKEEDQPEQDDLLGQIAYGQSYIGDDKERAIAKKLMKQAIETICRQAGKVDEVNIDRCDFIEPDKIWIAPESIATCEERHQDPQKIKSCILKCGGNIGVAIMYANGKYVKKDLNKAISYVCQDNYDANEYERNSMIKTLYTELVKGGLEKEFNYCSHVSSRNYVLACSSYEQKKPWQGIRKKFKQLPKSFTKEQKKAYDAMLESAFEFFDVRASSEQDLTGRMFPIFIDEWEQNQRIWLIETLEKLESGELKIEKKDYASADAEMEELYKKIIKKKEQDYLDYLDGKIGGIFISKEDIKNTQAKFPAYRDAFANFIHVTYPEISLDAARSWITKIRIQQLKELHI